VLDTWFSSALSFATLGWPEETPRYRAFYPGHALFTARDIINLWVARMVMMGIAFTGHEPFRDVVINPTVLAADGRRMSKSLGTGVDPLDLIARHGADATRYGLLKMSSTQDVRFAEGMIEEGRGLCNKLWNAARMILLKADPEASRPPSGRAGRRLGVGQLADAVAEVTVALDAYDFAAAVKALTASSGTTFATGTSRRPRPASTATTRWPRARCPRRCCTCCALDAAPRPPGAPACDRAHLGVSSARRGASWPAARARALQAAARSRRGAGRATGLRLHHQAAPASRRRASCRRARRSR
jgi:hypothetical protein